MATQQEVIKAFMKSLDTSTIYGVTALNNAVKACSSFKDLQSVIDQLISDCKSAKSVDSFLKEKCGIILDNDDTGAITGSDAGGSKTKTAESVVPETGTASYPSDTSFTKRELTVVVPSKSELTTDQQTVVQGLYSWWIDEALKLIEESYGYKFTDSDATVKIITVKFIDNSSAPAAHVTNDSTSTNGSAFKTTKLTLNVNMNYFKNLSASNVNGKSSKNPSYLDRVLAHELTHAIMAAKIDDAQELPNFITEGMAELTHGADDRASDIKQLVGNPTQLKNRLNVNNKAASTSPTDLDYAAGYIFLRYLAKQGASSYSPSTEDDETSKDDAYTLSETNSTITKGGTYTITKNFSGTIIIKTTDAVTIDGTNAGDLNEVKIVTSSSTADLTIKNLNITNEKWSVVVFGNDTGNKLTLAGKNVLKTDDTWAAVVNVGGGLTIDGTGSLDVTAGAQGSGIGSKSYGESNANITINNCTINATTDMGAGIGSGSSGSIGNITVNGGNVTVTSDYGAGIGSGSGYLGTMSGTINIGGSANVNATSRYGAGIGAGCDGSVGNISVKGNANVTATSKFAAGIGLGCDSKGESAVSSSAGKVTISGNSYVLITQQMDQSALIIGVKRPTKFIINGKTYTDGQMLFENGVKKKLSERIIVDKIVRNGTAKDDYIGRSNDSWYSAATINAGAGNDTIYASGANFLIYAGDGNDSIDVKGIGSFGVSSNLVAGYVTIDSGAGNDFVCLGTNFGGISDYHSRVKGGDGKDTIRVYGNYVTVSSDSGNDDIMIQGEYITVNAGTGNDLIVNDNLSYLLKGERLIPIGNKNIVYKYSSGDGDDTIDGFNENNVIQISGSTYTTQISGDDVLVKIGNGSILLKDAKYESLNIQTVKGGSSTDTTPSTLMTVTNSTKSPVTIDSAVKTVDASTRTTSVQITGNSLANSIKGGSKNDNLAGKEGNDSIYGNAGNDKLYGQADDDKLYGGSGNDSLYGGIGNDTLSGGAGDDYLKGGDGNDVFIFSAGNDVIADFTAGQDKIKLSNASIKSSSVNGDNVVFTLSTGKLTVTGGKDQNITIIDAKGNETTKKYSATNKTLTVTKDVTLGSSYQNADASKLTKGVKITGNSLNNSIKGGSSNDSISGLAGDDKITAGNGKDTLTGGDGKDLLYGQAGDDKIYGQGDNDSLYGGDGNDSLWGGVGNDWLKGGKGNDYLKGGDGDNTFVYIDGDGKDTISGFDNGDLLQITGTFSTSYDSSKREIYFKVGSTAKAITLTDFTATTFHVNNDTYQISGTKLLKK